MNTMLKRLCAVFALALLVTAAFAALPSAPAAPQTQARSSWGAPIAGNPARSSWGAAIGIVAPDTADAKPRPKARASHYGPYGEGFAEQLTYNVFNSHCGNGTTWICVNRNVYLDAYAYGEHSWRVVYWFAEQSLPFGGVRQCRVETRVNAHTGVLEQWYGEWC